MGRIVRRRVRGRTLRGNAEGSKEDKSKGKLGC
jgi:hypothetical protein